MMTGADPTKTREVAKYAHTAPLVSCRFDPTGQWLFAGGQDHKIARWNLTDGQKVELSGHDSWVRGMAFTPDGSQLITGGYDGRLIWWETAHATPTPLRTIQAHQGWIRSVAVSPDGQMIATCGNDLHVKLWQTATGEPLATLPGHTRHIYNLAFLPGGTQLVSGDLMGQFVLWDVANRQKTWEFKVDSLSKYDEGFRADYGGPHSLCLSADGAQLFASGITNVTNAFAGIGNPIVSQVDLKTGKLIKNHLTKGKLNGIAWGVAVHPDAFIIAATGGQSGGHLFFWKFDSEEEFHTLALVNTARDLSLHPDNLRLATAHHDHHVRIYEMRGA